MLNFGWSGNALGNEMFILRLLKFDSSPLSLLKCYFSNSHQFHKYQNIQKSDTDEMICDNFLNIDSLIIKVFEHKYVFWTNMSFCAKSSLKSRIKFMVKISFWPKIIFWPIWVFEPQHDFFHKFKKRGLAKLTLWTQEFSGTRKL